jgi:transcriptional regulator with XRE-family HTH domain
MADRSRRFATRLKDLRAAAGLSQPELAEAAGMPVGTVRGFEIGRREPTFNTLLLLARGLGVDLNAFAMEPEEKGKKRRKRK